MAFTNIFSLALILILAYKASETVSRPLENNTTTLSTRPMHNMRLMHEQWMAQYGRTYKHVQEKEKRFKIFKENVKRINKFNNGATKKSYTLRINQFTDLTSEEVRSTRKGSMSQLNPLDASMIKELNASAFSFYGDQSNIASFVDWRMRGAITPIKNQGQCGSCWTFATVAAIESINQITTGQLISLSEQDILDCLDTSGNGGCNGGVMAEAFNFIAQGNHLPTEYEYPYQGGRGQCMMPRGGEPGGVTISNWKYLLQANDFASLKSALNAQPVAISIDSNSFDFDHYGGGIYDMPLRWNYNDHDLLLIGYGTDENGIDYWLLKNSWGIYWGEEGYMRLLMDEYQCPIAQNAFAPVM
ncbi:actinidain-like [Silene latifolia]|uniref:actinidain-like n=1 Tax=Silene latifolia TaxID=37657 RepID=UPI003D786132